MADRLGDTLASARRSNGRTLSEAEAATKIRAKLLEALEHGDYDTLPNPAYVRGYIIGYAKFLELDPGPLLQQFAEETGHAPQRERLRVPDQVVPTRQQAQSIPWSTVLTVSAVVVVLALAIWGIGRLITGPTTPPPIPNVPEPTSAATPGPDGSGVGVPGEIPTTTPGSAGDQEPASAPFTVRIEVSSQAASWLRVTIDGLKAYEGTLSGGESKEWEVTDECVVRIGKPSAVTVFRDGEPVEIPPSAETPVLTLSASDPVQ